MRVIVLTACLGLAACSGAYEPQVTGAKTSKYATDLAECRAVAAAILDQGRPVQSEALAGAAFGGVIGALDDDGGVLENAAAGALVGASVGALDGLDDVDVIERAAIRSCLIERGYTVQG